MDTISLNGKIVSFNFVQGANSFHCYLGSFAELEVSKNKK